MVKMCNLAMLLYFENIEIVIIDFVWWNFAFSCFIDSTESTTLHLFNQPNSPGCPWPKKTANILGCDHWSPYEMVSEKPVQKPG